MTVWRLSYLILAILLIGGCTRSKHLSRKLEPFGARPRPQPAVSFDGRMNLVYERKIKGSVDSPIRGDGQYLGFNSTYQRFMLLDQKTGDQKARIKNRYGLAFPPLMHDSAVILVQKVPYGRVDYINLYTTGKTAERGVKEISSEPIIAIDRLILGTADGLRFLTLPDLLPDGDTRGEGAIYPGPVFDSGIVYYVADKRQMTARDVEKDLVLWQDSLEADAISKISFGRFIYLGLADGRLVALDKVDGHKVWEHFFILPVRGEVAEYGEWLYVGGTDRRIYCLAISDGREIWSFETEGIVTATPVVWYPAVVVGSQDRKLYSLHLETGALLDSWQLQGAITEAVVIADDRLYVADRKNRIYCFEGKK